MFPKVLHSTSPTLGRIRSWGEGVRKTVEVLYFKLSRLMEGLRLVLGTLARFGSSLHAIKDDWLRMRGRLLNELKEEFVLAVVLQWEAD